MVKLVSLFILLIKVAEPIDDMKEGLTVTIYKYFL